MKGSDWDQIDLLTSTLAASSNLSFPLSFVSSSQRITKLWNTENLKNNKILKIGVIIYCNYYHGFIIV